MLTHRRVNPSIRMARLLLALSLGVSFLPEPALQMLHAAEGATNAPRQVAAFSLPDLTGAEHTLQQWSTHKAVVLFFLGTECPVSNGYAPEMQRLADRFGALGVLALGVHGDPSVTSEDALEHAKEYGLRFPILLDPEQVLALATGVHLMPEVVVASPQGEVLYRGRIDDRFAPGGKRRDEPRVRELQDALEAVTAGKKPAITESKAFGCPLPKPRVAADSK